MEPTVGIIGGHGRMGSLFTKFFNDRGVSVLISDLDTKLTNKELASIADIVIVSVPIEHTEKVISEILPHLRKDCALMDFTSIKVPPLKIMAKAPGEVLGLHPMFGNSNPIPGQTIILCPTKKSGPLSKWLENFLRHHGAIIEKMTPEAHDKAMSIAQGLVHFVNIALANTLRELKVSPEKILRYSGPASELKIQLAARLLHQNPELYADIQFQNPNNTGVIQTFLKSASALAQTTAKNHRTHFINEFNKTKKFFGKYAEKAYLESSYLIDRHKEFTHKPTGEIPQKPHKTDLAVLGPKNTFSDQAAGRLPYNIYYTQTIEEIFALVESKKVAAGLVPIENKLEGTVRETIDQFYLRKVHACQSQVEKINHHLIILENTDKKAITKIISHPQALAQCRNYLKKHFPKAELQASTSTAAGAESILRTQQKSSALIGSEKLSKLSGLKSIAANIGDQKDNQTEFLLIKPGHFSALSCQLSVVTSTLIAFNFAKNKPGSLFSVFQEFADSKINLTKIESRPTKSTFGEYIFYLAFEGNPSEPQVQKVLKKITTKVAHLKILGTY